VSDTTDITSATPDEPGVPPLPRTINAALIAIAAQAALSVLYVVAFSLLGNTLRAEVIKANKKASKPKVLCSDQNIKGCLDVPHVVHTAQVSQALLTTVITLAMIMLALRIRKGSRSTRNIYIGVSLLIGLFGYPGSPIGLIQYAFSGPAVLRAFGALAGLASIFGIVLLLRPEAKAFFEAVSPRPAGAIERPGLGGLFRPRPPVNRTPAAKSDVEKAAPTGSAKAPKAKTRNDAEAVARGAELARTRAKAAKSRKTE
jgi:hypothetical protein